jgi:hypothetical protein
MPPINQSVAWKQCFSRFPNWLFVQLVAKLAASRSKDWNSVWYQTGILQDLTVLTATASVEVREGFSTTMRYLTVLLYIRSLELAQREAKIRRRGREGQTSASLRLQLRFLG